MEKFKFWHFYHDKLGVSYEEYLAYYKGHDKVHAWMIICPLRFFSPYTLKEIGQYAPQSYTIISK